MEQEMDVRLMEIKFLYLVDGELLFLVAQLFPFALCFGDILFRKLRDAVKLIPKTNGNFSLYGFLFCFSLSAGPTHLSYSTTRMCREELLGWGTISITPRAASSCMNRKVFPIDQRKMWLQSR